MQETALFRGSDPASETYRFLWLRSFDHPVALRLQNTQGSMTLTVRVASGAGGYDPGTLAVDETVSIGTEEWNTFLQLVEDADYWNVPQIDEDASGMDGARWILEAVKDDRYHIVDRWSPDPQYSSDMDLRFRRACLYLLKLSGLGIQHIY